MFKKDGNRKGLKELESPDCGSWRREITQSAEKESRLRY
jgi:hypothetical protein